MCSQFSVPSSPRPPPDPGPPETLRTEGGQLGTPGRGTLGTRPDCPRRRCKRCEVRGVSHRWRWGWAERWTASHVQGRPGSGLWKHSALLQPQMRVSGDSSPTCPCLCPSPTTSRLSPNASRPGAPCWASGGRAGAAGGGARRGRGQLGEARPSQHRSERAGSGRGGGIRSAVYIPRGAGSHFGSAAESFAGAVPLLAVGRRQRHSAERTSRLSSSSSSSGRTPAVTAPALVQPPSLPLLFFPSLAPW